MTTPTAAFRRILEVLDRLEIPYFVTGSVASSVYGIARTTFDLDLVADLREEHIQQLVSELRADFYADPKMMTEALERGRSFNLIHVPSSYKIDIFRLAGMNTAAKRSSAAATRKLRHRAKNQSSALWPAWRTSS